MVALVQWMMCPLLLQNGADKVSVNTAAFKNPQLIKDLSEAFGSQCVVLAIDTKKEEDGNWYVYLNGGRTKTDTLNNRLGCTSSRSLGAGEILLTSMNNDGTKNVVLQLTLQRPCQIVCPFPLLHQVALAKWNILKKYLKQANADAALAASIFHYKEIEIKESKRVFITLFNFNKTLMERYLMISPALVAIIIFFYMRRVQSKRNQKLKKRFSKGNRDLKDLLASKSQQENSDNDEN